MSDKTNALTWENYVQIVNGEFTDLVRKNGIGLFRKEQRSIRLPNYQIQYLKDYYPAIKFSDSLRHVIDRAIKCNHAEGDSKEQ